MTKKIEHGFISEKVNGGYLITFDPGSHLPQEVSVLLTTDEYQTISNNPKMFNKVVVPAMEKQGVQVI